MSSASLEVRIDAPIGRVFDVIVDYARYPEFVPGVKGCRVVGGTPGAPQVEYEVDLGVKRVRYVLAHREERPRRVSWRLVRGELLSRSDGSWEMEEVPGGTRARYTADLGIERPPLLPRALVDRIVEELARVQLPAMVRAFKARAERGA